MASDIGGGSSGLLLRLFESSFFNVHLAIGYLKTYPTSIGITHYLVDRLRSFDPKEVEFYWSQLCYLVITRPTPSVALENFILERCELDPHIGVITLWYFQSALSDLAATPTTPQFNVCKRVYNRVQSIIFTDPPNPSPLPTLPPIPSPPLSTNELQPISTSQLPSILSWSRLKPIKKINSTLATLVGIGTIGSSVGMPLIANGKIGAMTLEQGCSVEVNNDMMSGSKDDEEDNVSESESEDGDEVNRPSLPPKGNTSKGLPDSPGSSYSKSGKRGQTLPSYLPGAKLEASSPLISSTSSQNLYSPSAVISSTLKDEWKSTDQPIASPNSHRSRAAPGGIRSDTLSLSVPSLPLATQSASYIPSLFNRSSTLSFNSPLKVNSNSVPTNLPPSFLSHLLMLQSCRSQLDLLRSLQDISTRLVLVPKQARLSSLRAELTVLNHGLPRGCCLGMACNGSSFSSPSSFFSPSSPSSTSTSTSNSNSQSSLIPHPHDRIVRISPSESAVLNSADRAPFVIHVEVLSRDLDFDPFRRQNAEDLRRALKEREKSMGGGGGLGKDEWKGRMSLESGLDNSSYNNGTVSRESTSTVISRRGSAVESKLGEGGGDLGSSNLLSTNSIQESITTIPTEVDLVEQLYGDISIQEGIEGSGLNLEEKDTSIQNREVDELAWARIHEVVEISKDVVDSTRPSTPLISLTTPPSTSTSNSTATSVPLSPSPSLIPSRPSLSTRPTISLDQYAERMRMAAIMLSQLDASQAAAMSVVATGTAAAGTLVGLPVATVAGIGGAVGFGLLKLTSPFLSKKRDVQPGQASIGVKSSMDKLSAAAGTSDVAGVPPLPDLPVSSIGSNSNSSSNNLTLPPNHNHRQRLLTPLEASAIRNKIMDEMLILEEERMLRMKLDGNTRSGWIAGGAGGVEDGAVVMRAVNTDDPSGAVFRESFASKTSRIRSASPYGHLPSWNVISVIVKTGADLRQEQLAIQLIKEFGRIWKEEGCEAWVRYFRILVTSEGSGLIETITDAVSIHSIKKDAYARTAADGTQVFTSFTLLDHYIESYGEITSSGFKKAQKGFISSLAAYSVICYLLQLKDRHNGNILVDKDGHLIHIDFGFMLSNSPGSIGFEMAPFKLPQEYIDVLGGFESEKFLEFKVLFKQAFRASRKHAERIITLVELMQKDSNLPCFSNGEFTSSQLRERFQLSLTTVQVDEFVEKLILSSATSSFTKLYDLFQGYSNGIL